MKSDFIRKRLIRNPKNIFGSATKLRNYTSKTCRNPSYADTTKGVGIFLTINSELRRNMLKGSCISNANHLDKIKD